MDDQRQYFVELIEQNKSIIFKFCYMYSTEKDTPEDLFQEVLINLWQSFPTFRGDSKIQTWIYRISLNTCVTFLRKSGKSVRAMPLTDDMVVFAEESQTQDIRELYTLINKLKAIEKAIILLYLEERSYEEIAQIVGITKSNVGVRIVRIKEKLQQLSSL